MRHAYLIISHNEYNVLKTLLFMLDDERNDIYLHIDRRSTELFKQVCLLKVQKAQLFILPTRNEVYWGDISQVETEYLLLETASKRNSYAYYHLLSGVDLPIQTQDYIHSFFQANFGKEFVSYWLGEKHLKDLNRKVSLYYFFTKSLKRSNNKWHAVTAPCHNLALIIQKIIRFRRKHEIEFKKGSNWFSITHDFCQYAIEKKPFVLRRFKYTLCPDEIFIQTLLWNSPFKENIYKVNEEDAGSMRLIDWNRGNPYTWKMQDYKELISSDRLFARKFNSGDMELIKLIETTYQTNDMIQEVF